MRKFYKGPYHLSLCWSQPALLSRKTHINVVHANDFDPKLSTTWPELITKFSKLSNGQSGAKSIAHSFNLLPVNRYHTNLSLCTPNFFRYTLNHANLISENWHRSAIWEVLPDLLFQIQSAILSRYKSSTSNKQKCNLPIFLWEFIANWSGNQVI